MFWLGLWVLLFFGGTLLGPLLPAWPDAFAKLFSACLLIFLSFGLVSAFSALSWHRNLYLGLGLAGILLVLLTAGFFVKRTNLSHHTGNLPGQLLLMGLDACHPRLSASPAAVEARNALYQELAEFIRTSFPIRPHQVFLLCLSQLVLAAGIGLWIGTGIDAVGHLIPIALVAGIADIWSVSAGTTALIIQSSTIHYFLLRFPLLGGSEFYYPLLIGLTDFLFFGLFFQATRRFDLGLKKNILLLGFSFLLAVTAALFFSVGLPVLPFMAICFLTGNYRRLTMTREEVFQMVGFLIGIAVMGFLATKFLHS